MCIRDRLGIALVGISSSTIFLGMVVVALRRHRVAARRERIAAAQVARSELPPITIFKPLHGMEPNLGDNLSSFFLQDYPVFEIIFGAREAGDAALGLVEDLRRKFPQVTSQIVVSGPPVWPNAKVCLLYTSFLPAINCLTRFGVTPPTSHRVRSMCTCDAFERR